MSVRDVAQSGSALAWGARGRRFESCHPDFQMTGVFGQPEAPFLCSDLHFRPTLKSSPLFPSAFSPCVKIVVAFNLNFVQPSDPCTAKQKTLGSQIQDHIMQLAAFYILQLQSQAAGRGDFSRKE